MYKRQVLKPLDAFDVVLPEIPKPPVATASEASYAAEKPMLLEDDETANDENETEPGTPEEPENPEDSENSGNSKPSVAGWELSYLDAVSYTHLKAQQDAFLPYVEKGSIILIGATTENPSFEINAALLSRCKVFVLQALQTDDLVMLLHHALTSPLGLGDQRIGIDVYKRQPWRPSERSSTTMQEPPIQERR